MGEAEPIPERNRTHVFRPNARAARWAIAMLALLFLLILASVLFGSGFDPSSNDPLWAGLAGAFLVGLMAALAWLMRTRPVLLRIGMEGIDMPVGFSRPLAWNDIHRIRRLPARQSWPIRREWLVVDPAPGVLPDWRLAGPRRLELWLMPRWGIRIPLHALDAPPDDVIASIERFRPVIVLRR